MTETPSPSPEHEPAGRFGWLKQNDLWKLLSSGVREQSRYYVIAIIAMVVVALTSAATAWVMQSIIDTMAQPDNTAAVMGVAGLVILIFTTKGIANYVQSVFMSRAGNQIVANQQLSVYRKLMRQGVAFYNLNESSNLMMKITTGAASARALIETFVSSLARDALTLVGLVAVMIYQQPLLSMVSLIFGPLAILGIRLIVRKVRDIMEKQLESSAEFIKALQETSRGIQVIKIFSLEDQMNARMERTVREIQKRSNKSARLEAITSPLMESLSGFAIAGVVALSSVTVLGAEATTPGKLMSFITALLMAYEPAKRLSRMRISVERNMVGVRMLFGILNQPDMLTQSENATPLQSGPGKVVLDQVSFAYQDDRRVLRDVDLTFEGGKTTALVGQSGSGKSTVMNLVMRMYDPVSGKVTIDGQDISEVTFDTLRARMSYVGQDTFLFGTTVMENLRMSRPDASYEEVIAAAKDANAHEFIMELAHGYHTEVGENGGSLSGGQRQRLSIARAMLRNAEILLLDEATSALDATSEALIKEALDRITKDKTTIVIAHRLSTILSADQIYVLQDGHVVEGGSADELLAKGGAFKTLFDQQFSSRHQRK
ncbi:ABC transporter ATP-binding protein [Thioclava sp. SK-1]|uniref:ABC transporter ATP-binding protein n=1 Tax=Thioclava sp. SK-1 TaxID=1889770 RepID=UPI0009F25384|nr:ABC transporter ATP-binding protein [Thioclava sp. SK-1]